MQIRLMACLCGFLIMTGLGEGARAETPTPEEIKESNREFAGVSFGVGLSVTVDTGDRDRVSSAVIDANGVVRVNKTDNVRTRVMLETHYFFPWKKDGDLVTHGWGPFIAIQPGTDEIVEAIGAGLMIGFLRKESPGSSFNIGVGYVVEPEIQVLGSEFIEGMPAPLGPDGEALPIRYQQRDQGGVLALVSFRW